MPVQDSAGRWWSKDGRWWWDGAQWQPATPPGPQRRPREPLLLLLTAFGTVGMALNVLGLILFAYHIPGPNFGLSPEAAGLLLMPVLVPLSWLGPPAFLAAIVWWIMVLRKRRSRRG